MIRDGDGGIAGSAQSDGLKRDGREMSGDVIRDGDGGIAGSAQSDELGRGGGVVVGVLVAEVRVSGWRGVSGVSESVVVIGTARREVSASSGGVVGVVGVVVGGGLGVVFRNRRREIRRNCAKRSSRCLRGDGVEGVVGVVVDVVDGGVVVGVAGGSGVERVSVDVEVVGGGVREVVGEGGWSGVGVVAVDPAGVAIAGEGGSRRRRLVKRFLWRRRSWCMRRSRSWRGVSVVGVRVRDNGCR